MLGEFLARTLLVQSGEAGATARTNPGVITNSRSALACIPLAQVGPIRGYCGTAG